MLALPRLILFRLSARRSFASCESLLSLVSQDRTHTYICAEPAPIRPLECPSMLDVQSETIAENSSRYIAKAFPSSRRTRYVIGSYGTVAVLALLLMMKRRVASNLRNEAFSCVLLMVSSSSHMIHTSSAGSKRLPSRSRRWSRRVESSPARSGYLAPRC